MTPENDTKYDEKIQNNRLPFGFSDFVPGDFFVCIVMLHECTVHVIFVHVRET